MEIPAGTRPECDQSSESHFLVEMEFFFLISQLFSGTSMGNALPVASGPVPHYLMGGEGMI